MEILQLLLDFFTTYGYVAVFFVLIVCGFGLPIPEDITLVAGGIICGLSLTTKYPLNVYIMMFVALSGVLIGDVVMFSLGRFVGPKVTRMPFIRKIITPGVYLKMQQKTHRYGNKILFFARFLPGLRAPIFLTAGVSRKVPLWKFLLMDGLAALISVPLWVYLGFIFAYDIDKVLFWLHKSQFLIITVLIIGALGILIYARLIKKKRSNIKNHKK
ncbi:MAG: DedA family protein [Burkholderiales bacterium]|jgi:membrane protein DedA with SNARE-associated domain|nr:DedA family protein [Burkholderiales bacterium]MCE3267989.1 DedA family protein [Burkholderiales bacterium]